MAVCTTGKDVSNEPQVKPGTIAVVSHAVPGGCSGQAVMLQRLGQLAAEEGHGPGLLFVDTDRKALRRARLAGDLPVEPIRVPWLLRKLNRLRGFRHRQFPWLVRYRARRIAAIVRRHQAAAIVGCTGGDLIDVPAAIEAGQQTGLPTYLYYFDDYAVQWEIAKETWLRDVLPPFRDASESHLLEQAAGIIVPNETLAEDIYQRTETPTVVVRNPVDTQGYAQLRDQFPRRQTDPVRPLRIVYTGSVYTAQADSIRRCSQAIAAAALRGIEAVLHIYGPPPDREVQAELHDTSIVWHQSVSPEESAAVQVQADLLFLPLSFTCSYPQLIRSSAPGKFGEYLASGTPMLVHAPEDSFPVRFVSKHDCAAICSNPEVEKLTDTICSLAKDAAIRDRLGKAAIAAAADFCQQRNSRRFVEFIQERMPANR
ncbi:MAG: hypothetical protein EBU59_08150 [Planctomycetia bacterium]|nr:hypothetical protein [Planctomycetia bacterium]